MNSLRVRLALWVLLPLSIALSLSLWFLYQDSVRNARRQQDHTLWASAHIIAGQVQWMNGQLSSTIPPVALEVFSSDSHDTAYFSVTTGDGRLLAGWPDLADMAGPAEDPDAPDYRNIEFHHQRLRSYTMVRDFFNSGKSVRVFITVAKTEKEFLHDADILWRPNLIRQTGVLALVLVLMLLGLRHELRPLAKLKDEVLSRERSDLRPIRLQDLPMELRPVVDTINQYAQRIQRHIDSRKRFIEDAAHHLRTPMTLLSTQLHYASSLATSPELKRILAALSESRQQITLLVNQLLSLSQAENYRPESAPAQDLDACDVARDVLVELAPLGASRGIDLGIGDPFGPAPVRVPPTLLRALVFNLIDNAIRYTPPGGRVTLTAGQLQDAPVRLEVLDTGPGIPPELRARVFERFNRGNATSQEGTGLGLAIVAEAAKACRATVTLGSGQDGKGLRVTVDFHPPA